MKLSVHLVSKNKMGVLLILIVIELISQIFCVEDLPCEFQDSINITNDYMQFDTIKFDNITFHRKHYAKIDYNIVDGAKTSSPPYFRGCPCFIKTCIQLCCPYGKVNVPKEKTINRLFSPGEYFFCDKNDNAENLDINIMDENNETSTVKLHEQFFFVIPSLYRMSYSSVDFHMKEVCSNHIQPIRARLLIVFFSILYIKMISFKYYLSDR